MRLSDRRPPRRRPARTWTPPTPPPYVPPRFPASRETAPALQEAVNNYAAHLPKNFTPLDVGQTIFQMGKDIFWDLPNSIDDAVLAIGRSISGESPQTPDLLLKQMVQQTAQDWENPLEYASEHPGYFLLDLLGALGAGSKVATTASRVASKLEDVPAWERLLTEERGGTDPRWPQGYVERKASLDEAFEVRDAPLRAAYDRINKRLESPYWLPHAERSDLVKTQAGIRERRLALLAERDAAREQLFGEYGTSYDEVIVPPPVVEKPPPSVLVAGETTWNDEAAIREYLQKAQTEGIERVVAGAAPGADTIAAMVARELGMDVIEYPAAWKRYAESAGPRRNQQMLDMEGMGIREVVGFTDKSDGGTIDLLDRADKWGFRTRRFGHPGRAQAPAYPQPVRLSGTPHRYTPEEIKPTTLPENSIVVREGPSGRINTYNYGVQIRTGGQRTVPVNYIHLQLRQLMDFARRNPEKHVYITRLPGVPPRVFQKFFFNERTKLPANVHLPEDWDFRGWQPEVPSGQPSGSELVVIKQKPKRVTAIQTSGSENLIEIDRKIGLAGTPDEDILHPPKYMEVEQPDIVYTRRWAGPEDMEKIADPNAPTPLLGQVNDLEKDPIRPQRVLDPDDPKAVGYSFEPEQFMEPELTDEMLEAGMREVLEGGPPRLLRIGKDKGAASLVDPKSPNYDPEHYVYIGRSGKGLQGPWGNPFTIKSEGSAKAAVAKYETWIRAQLKTRPGLWKKLLQDLDGKTLVCFAHAPPCHGQVLLKIIGEIKNVLRRAGQL